MKQDIGRNTAYRSALFESFSDHTLTEQEYISLKQEYDRKADSYQKELEELVREEQDFSKTISPQNYWIKALKKCQAEETVTREMAVELIDHIKVIAITRLKSSGISKMSSSGWKKRRWGYDGDGCPLYAPFQ